MELRIVLQTLVALKYGDQREREKKKNLRLFL